MFFIIQYFKTGTKWYDQNIIVDGKFKPINLFGFFTYCFVYVLVNNMCFVTMYLTNQAGINVGLITTIWAIFPLYSAIADRLLFGTRLYYFHWLGLLSIIACSLFIGAQGIIDVENQKKAHVVASRVPTWLPIMMGFLSPVSFAMFGINTKYLTQPKVGFDPIIMSFASYVVSNIIILIIAVIYWNLDGSIPFDQKIFWLGFISSSFHTLGSACISKAYAMGPTGPVAAVTCICNVGLIFVEAVKTWKWLTNLQSIGVLLGIFGSAMLVIPDEMEKYVLCCFF
jgi:drug/metabolite transporter (DMT)-like permease